jgi:hypothetical protein
LIAQRMLGRIAFPRIADDEKREIAAGGAIDGDVKDARRSGGRRRARSHGRIDHGAAPLVNARLRNLLPRRGRPVLAIEVPGESPDRMHGDQHRGDWQAGTNQLPDGAEQRVVLEVARHRSAQA